ncbi:MAG: YkgJ family cysteine cluster protein [archaeon]|nr:YkgJ family cysteine cluster protein [archaeon]MCP8306858.1 YkgJ family cysteine cluster protein [archaeon]
MTCPLKPRPRAENPCRVHRCIECCIQTEMPLTKYDVERIKRLGFEKNFFVIEDGGSLRLKNESGRCVFLRDYGCSIYEYRPEGCRLYPLVYNPYKKHFEMDYLCPFNFEFKISEEDVEYAKRFIQTLEVEEMYRRKKSHKRRVIQDERNFR